MKNKKLKLFVNRLVESRQTKVLRRMNRQSAIKTQKLISSHDDSKETTSLFSS